MNDIGNLLDACGISYTDKQLAKLDKLFDELLKKLILQQYDFDETPQQHDSNLDFEQNASNEEFSNDTKLKPFQHCIQELQIKPEPHNENTIKEEIAEESLIEIKEEVPNDPFASLETTAKSFQSQPKPDLKRHIENVHEGIKPLKCIICDYEFTKHSNLKKHIESVHEGIKPFKCNMCQYETAHKPHLKIHIESLHEGIKGFKCTNCKYETATKSSLIKHMTVIHEKKKNQNNTSKNSKEICEASIVTSNIVVANKEEDTRVKSKTSIQPFCQNCNQTFVNEDPHNVHSCLVIKQEAQEIMEYVIEDSQNDQILSVQSIKVEPYTLKQSQMLDTADPLLIHEIKNEVFEENEATPIKDLATVYIKQEEEFDASGYQIVQENGMIVQEIKKESVFLE